MIGNLALAAFMVGLTVIVHFAGLLVLVSFISPFASRSIGNSAPSLPSRT